MNERNIRIVADASTLAEHIAGWLTDLAVASTGRFTLSLSGGSTPKTLFERLATPPFRDTFPWARTHVFWGDERLVPEDHPESNYRMTRLALLDHVAIPAGNVHPIRLARTPGEAASNYEQILKTYYGSDALDTTRPLFDVTLLGLGEDGHTASLFPGTPALDDSAHWVAPVTVGVPQSRVTLTYPAIACSAAIAFLVAGASKVDAMRRVRAGDRSAPAARITGVGEVIWFVDEAAAG